jgi:branched-chain amino acid transport system substrate-binding protein
MPHPRTPLLAAWLSALCTIALGPAAQAQIPGNKVTVGVLTDVSGQFSDGVGAGSVAAARLAAQDFAPESGGLQVEIIFADHQNRPDIGAGIARKWLSQDGVAAIVDLPNSGVALAVAGIAHDLHRTALTSSSMSSDLTGKACQPTTVQWVTDTWAQGRSTAAEMVPQGLNNWYFLTVNYALGHALEADATAAVTALGGKVAGASRNPFNTSDFAGPLLQAQASGANVLALASTGSDLVNALKQASEFGLTRTLTPAALFAELSDVRAIGLPVAQGLQLTEAFYWDLNDSTRAWSARYGAVMGGLMPTEDQAGVYSATLAYLRAARDAGTIEGEQVVAAMKRAPIADPLFGTVTIRGDGRAVHDMYRFRVKAPRESRGPDDLYQLLAIIPAASAFRPPDQGGCAMVRP